jgi:hypothetical protein
MQINIKFVNLPRVGSTGKYGSIVGQDGTRVMVPVDLLGQFRAGMTVDVPTKAQTWGQGTDREAQVIIATSGPGGGSTGAVQGQGYSPSIHGTPDRNTGQRANTGFRPTVYQGGAGQQPAAVDQGRQIFVTGTVGRAMGSGKFAASELPVLTQAACEAYDKVLNAPPRTAGSMGQNEPIEPPSLEPGDPGPVDLQ